MIGILRDSIGLLRDPDGYYLVLSNVVGALRQEIAAMFGFVGGIYIEHHKVTGRRWNQK